LAVLIIDVKIRGKAYWSCPGGREVVGRGKRKGGVMFTIGGRRNKRGRGKVLKLRGREWHFGDGRSNG